MLEKHFQAKLIKEVEALLPGSIVSKVETTIQGFPDILILYEDKWATLECKRNKSAERQPNQTDYVDRMNAMSFSRFVYPENKEEVLNDLQQALRNSGETCDIGAK